MLNERKLTERELESRESVLKGLLANKRNLVKKYGKDAEKVMYGIATKKAKSKVEGMNKNKIKELIQLALEGVDSSPRSNTDDINIDKSYSSGADYGSEVSANTAEDNTEVGELSESLNPEVTKAVSRFIKAMAKRYSYSEKDAVFAIQAALKQRNFDGLNEANIGLADLEEVGYTDGDKAVAMHFNHDVIGINNDVDFQAYRKGFIQGVNDATIGFSLDERVAKIDEILDEGVVKDMHIFLNDLRDSGVTNMFGAAPYLQDEFGLEKGEARQVLANWMQSFSENLDEMDMNDPVLMRMRASKPEPSRGGIDYDEALNLRLMLSQLEDSRDRLFRDMEQEAEPEGGPIADRYGDELNKIEDRIYKIRRQLNDYDMNESTRKDLGMVTSVSKRRAKAELKNPGNDGSKVSGLDKDGKRVYIKSIKDVDKFFDFELDADLKEGASKEDQLKNESKKTLKEYTDNSFKGSEVIDDANERGPDMFGKGIFADLLPKGVASENDAIEALKAHDKSPIKARMGRYAPMFVHLQYHDLEHEGEKYRMHQTQYYNSNFKDKDPDFNPGTSKITLFKITKPALDRRDKEESDNLGTIVVKTDQYVQDLNNLPGLGKRVSESNIDENLGVEIPSIVVNKANAKITNAKTFAQFILDTWDSIIPKESESISNLQTLKIARAKLEAAAKVEDEPVAEKLTKKSSVGDHIEDFKDSDAKQFKGKSNDKKIQMAVASFLSKQGKKKVAEGFKVGDKVTMKGGGEEMEITNSRKMLGSKLNAYSVKKSNGKTAEYDESQLKLSK